MADGQGTDVDEDAATSDERRRAAVAAVGHRVRTPLAVAQGLVHEMGLRGPGTLRDSDVDMLGQQLRAVHADVELLVEVAGWPATSARRPIDLAAEVRAVASAVQADLNAEGISLELVAPERLVVLADAARLRWLVRALLAYPRAHSERGATVEVALTADPPTLRVGARGPRRPGEHPGWADAELVLVEHVVHLHDGELTLTNAGGAEELLVRLRVPAAARTPRADHRRPSEAPPEPPEAPLVLVIEDDEAMRHFLDRTLSGDYRVATAASGREGTEAARRLRPDLIVCDLVLPGVSGERVVSDVAADPQLAGIPVMVLSGRTDEEVRTRLLEEGADDYVVKPFVLRELRARVANLVGQHLDEQALQSKLDQASTLADQLQQALDSRVLIEQAKGFIAAERHLSVDAAFEVLRREARAHNRPLRDVAHDVVHAGAHR